jgi:hypothetical protein
MAKNLTRYGTDLFRDLVLKYITTKPKPMGLYYRERRENARGKR